MSGPNAPESAAPLRREFGLLQATALNMTNMVGIGPFITLPLLMTARCALLPERAEGRRMEVGRQAVTQLLTRFPHSPYRNAALGLQGRYALGRNAEPM